MEWLCLSVYVCTREIHTLKGEKNTTTLDVRSNKKRSALKWWLKRKKKKKQFKAKKKMKQNYSVKREIKKSSALYSPLLSAFFFSFFCACVRWWSRPENTVSSFSLIFDESNSKDWWRTRKKKKKKTESGQATSHTGTSPESEGRNRSSNKGGRRPCNLESAENHRSIYIHIYIYTVTVRL